jgi:hypothetical protein
LFVYLSMRARPRARWRSGWGARVGEVDERERGEKRTRVDVVVERVG